MKIIAKLKKRLIKLNKKYHIEIYKILNEIYRIQNKSNSKYTIYDLSQETVIKDFFSYDYVNTIMQTRFITKEVSEYIRLNKITQFEVCNLLRKSKKLHNKEEQNKFFKANLNKPIVEIRRLVTTNNKMKAEDIWILQTIYEIRNVRKNIMSRFSLLNYYQKAMVTREIKELYDFINGKGLKEYKLIPIKKASLKRLRKIKGTNKQNQSTMIEYLIERELK